MEQKTEASQAVDVKPWQIRAEEFDQQKMKWFSLPPAPEYFMRQEIADLRAALKAQPAPTEAQDEPVAWFEAEPSAKGLPLREVIGGMIHSTRMHTTKPEVLNNALWPLYEHPAQGEDSARLDAALIKAREWIVKNRPALTLSRAKTIDEYMSLLDIIDRARASAETGGVKS